MTHSTCRNFDGYPDLPVDRYHGGNHGFIAVEIEPVPDYGTGIKLQYDGSSRVVSVRVERV